MTQNPIAIHAQGLRKVFRVYAHPFDALVETVTHKSRHIERVALESIDLEVQRGEIVGVLGRNGAGKSTLLKLIAGTLERSSGKLTVNGRITAILELGTGFHPDYTGRENIYMGGLCLGMNRNEVKAKINDIIEFSELQDVIDQPFKTYSTGMQARLTFSTAISVEPDILIVDEALSVGDARFQMKCFSHMQQLREKKTTILLVSHDTNTITTLCDRALILENGKVYAEGAAKKVSVLYHNMLFGQQKKQADKTSESFVKHHELQNFSNITSGKSSKNDIVSPKKNKPHTTEVTETSIRYGTGEAHLVDWGIFNSQGKRISVLESGTKFYFSMTLTCKQDVDDLSCGFAVKDRRGTVLWGVTNLTQQGSPYRAAAGETLHISASGVMWLAAGDYFVTLGIARLHDGEKIDFIEDAIGFRVIGPDNIFTTSLVNLQTKLEITSCSEKQEILS